jgi:hypothetical protein
MAQPLARRQPAEIVLPQPANGSMQHTQLQLETLEHLVGIGLVSYDRVYRDTEAY